ncbi:hypothetical protein B0I33_105425 [Prauserella shujinwangii]|uniref:Flagellar basal body-associated protein FliL n=1 Tax=Prauserella shujinwangii TaxID=1453103 RepID=A0A2T0LVH3_9PSEU|nr:flagellar basal body-associated protein FliL [Prauserella shujinwangii]PRX47842.1 hypothetical protein B0I33_105425 [Prauserella shujinwangii]
MTWQEELRKLDEELASGRLSADEYRTRRDQVLSSAVAPAEQQPQGTGNAESTQVIEPVSGQPGASQQQGQYQQNEATQAVPPGDAGGERTQVVPNWQTQAPHSSPAGGFPQPHSSYAGSPPAGFAQPGQQPWNAPQDDPSPPWGGTDFPPIAPQTHTDWVSQGPETFETTSTSGSGRKVLFSVLGVVIVAGLSVLVWFLFIKGDGENQAGPGPQPSQQSQAAPSPSSSALPEPPPTKAVPSDNDAALIDPPGQTRDGGGAFDLATLRENKLLAEPVIAALEDGDLNEGLLKASKDGDSTIGLYSLEVSDENAAIEVAQQYAVVQQEGGIPAAPELSLQGVQVFGAASDESDSVFRAVYVLYKRVVIVEVYGPDKNDVQQTFESLLGDQIEHAPPTYRES